MIVETQEQLNTALLSISRADIIAFDTETDGLNVRSNKIIGLGIHTGLQGFYFVLENHIKLAANAIAGKRLVGWNSYFDLEMIRNNYNIDLWNSLYCDVLMLKHTCDEEYPFKLKEVACKYIGYHVKAEQKDLNESIKARGGKAGEVWLGETTLVGKYCIQDCKLTRDLFVIFSKKLVSDNLVKFFYEDEVMPLYKEVTRYLQSTGIEVDVKSLTKARTEITNDINNLETRILLKIQPLTEKLKFAYFDKHYPISKSGKFGQIVAKIAGVLLPRTKSGKFSIAKSAITKYSGNPWIDFLLGDSELNADQIKLVQQMIYAEEGSPEIFNLNSKHQLKALFFDVMSEKPLSFTDGGAPQVNEEFLQSVKNKYEWVNTLLDYNKLQKLKSAYIDRVLERHENGIFYPQFKQHGTISGRFSSDLQQIPRKAEAGQFSEIVTKYRNLMRTFFIAGEDNRFIDADYESLEPHVFAHVSTDPDLQSIFAKGDDFYSTIAIATEALQGVSASKKADNYLGKVDKLRRQTAKAYSLGIPYGMEDYALHKKLECSQKQAVELINGYLNAYPKLKEWMAWSNGEALEKHQIVSETGRIRRFPQLQRIQDTWNIIQLQNSLDLWQAYHQDEKVYEKAKKARNVLKNALNNAKNFQIQSLSASIVNRAAININRKLGDLGKVVTNVHDQLIIKCKDMDAEKVARIVQFEMENVMKLTVTLKAPAEIGTNFADAH
ncbi:MAG TPA: DNA polymerase [Yeosuana sp.]